MKEYTRVQTKKDGRFYDVFTIDTNEEVVFYVSKYSTRTTKARYEKEPEAIIDTVVNEAIDSMQHRFGLNKLRLAKILDKLQTTTITNHFDYLKLLSTVTPDIEKLLQ